MKRLFDPFDRNKTIEEMIYEVEDVYMFFMSIPLTDRKLPEITLIDHLMIKLKSTGSYTKAIAKWKTTAGERG